MYKEKILVTSNDVDHHLKIKISSIFKFLQQVSTNHSEILKIGKKQTTDVGLSWVITRMHLVIYSLPEMNDEIVVTTHPGEVKKFIFPRYYEIYDKQGKLLISGSSLWVVIDSVSRHVNMNPFGERKFAFETNKDDIPLPERINLNSDLKLIENRRVRYSDIDLNGHLNNVKYIEYMVDLHDKNFYDEYQIKEILINYERECHDNEIVNLSLLDKDMTSFVKGDVGGTTSFTSIIKYDKR